MTVFGTDNTHTLVTLDSSGVMVKYTNSCEMKKKNEIIKYVRSKF